MDDRNLRKRDDLALLNSEEYLIGRYYDPATGQFLSVDPLVDETGQPYAYTGDDPVNGTDPMGAISAGQICGMDGLNSQACRGAIQISAQVGKEVAANQVGGCAPIIDIAGAIASHWRGIVHVTIVVAAISGGIVCALATAGVCGEIIGTVLVTVVGGAAEGAADHALDGQNQTPEGYAVSAGEGSLQEVASAIPEDYLFGGGGAQHAVPAGFWSTLRHLLDNF